MKKIREYVEGMFKDVPDSKEKTDIVQEIILNLEEKVQDLIEQGKEEEDAINKSIVEFGDITEIKSGLMNISGSEQKRPKSFSHANNLMFSVFGSMLLIGLFIFINFYYSPNTIWFVYPMFAVLWWPLSLFFVWLNNRKKGKDD